MAKDTSYGLRKEAIYQVFPRCYSKEGTLRKVIDDLDRIKDLGFTIVYFLPLHEPGILNRKGTCGSPYSIRDYYAIDPSIGTMEEFEELIQKAHLRNMKVMTDIVINHTACDSVWSKSHPEYYLLDESGNPTRKVPDWSDIIDLKYENIEVQDELIDMLKFWARKGVDAFRCDVAPLVPIEFWNRARKELKEINPNFFMLAESVEEEFIEIIREQNIDVLTDNELYEAFDICYSYDIKAFFDRAIQEDVSLKEYARIINYQTIMLPKNAMKIWFLENHDRTRIMSLLNDEDKVNSWLAFTLLLKGIGFVYAGEEVYEKNTPSLFEKSEITWQEHSASDLVCKCNKLKKDMFNDEAYVNSKMIPYDDILAFRTWDNEHEYYAYFDVRNKKSKVKVDLEDGKYMNLLNDTEIEVKGHELFVDGPMMVKTR